MTSNSLPTVSNTPFTPWLEQQETLAEGINAFLHSLHSSLPAFRTTISAEPKVYLARGHMALYILSQKKPYKMDFVQYSLACCCVIAHVCP